MTYRVEVTINDIAYIKACVLGMVRRMQGSTADEATKIKFTTAAAESLTKLNEAALSTREVMFFNVCLQKTYELLRDDKGLSFVQREEARGMIESIQNKLAGINVTRTILSS